jgi:hypothetical protein
MALLPPAKLAPKWSQNQLRIGLKTNPRIGLKIGPKIGLKFITRICPESVPNRTKIDLKLDQNQSKIVLMIGPPKNCAQYYPQNHPQIVSKSSQNKPKIVLKIVSKLSQIRYKIRVGCGWV